MADLRTSLAYRVYRLQRLMRRHFLSIATEAGFEMTPEQFFVLNKLASAGGQPQSALVDESLQDRPNLTRMVRELEQRGWLYRERDPGDGRRRLVHLTDAGAEVLERFMNEVILPGRGDLFSQLDPEDLDTTHRVFDALENQLT